jgi:ABC-2 type transport system permease protein
MLGFSSLPMVVWPLRSVTVGMAELILSIPVIVTLTLAFGARPTWGVLLVPIGLFWQLLLCFGLATLGASLAVTFPDVEKLSALLIRIFFWSSPILWSQRNFPEWIQPWLYLNPFHGVLDMYRAAIWPDDVLAEPSAYLMSGTVILVILAAGMLKLHRSDTAIRRLG